MVLIGCMFESYEDPEALQYFGSVNNEEIKLFSFIPEDINWDKKSIYGSHFIDGEMKKQDFPFPDAVFNRCYEDKLDTILKLETVLGKKVFNHINWLDKWLVYCVLYRTDIKEFLPATYIFNYADFIDLLKLNKSLIIKPCKGHIGKGIYRFELKDNGDIVYYLENFYPRTAYKDDEKFKAFIDRLIGGRLYIIQHEIPLAKVDGNIFDIRVLVQKDINGFWVVSATLSRIAVKNFFLTNVYTKICTIDTVLSQINVDVQDLKNTIFEISLRTAEILDQNLCFLGEISVDFGLDASGKPWIIEVNGKPGKFLFENLGDKNLYKDIYAKPIEYAYFLAKQ